MASFLSAAFAANAAPLYAGSRLEKTGNRTKSAGIPLRRMPFAPRPRPFLPEILKKVLDNPVDIQYNTLRCHGKGRGKQPKSGPVVQLVRTLACHARGRRFEPVPGRHLLI